MLLKSLFSVGWKKAFHSMAEMKPGVTAGQLAAQSPLLQSFTGNYLVMMQTLLSNVAALFQAHYPILNFQRRPAKGSPRQAVKTSFHLPHISQFSLVSCFSSIMNWMHFSSFTDRLVYLLKDSMLQDLLVVDLDSQ